MPFYNFRTGRYESTPPVIRPSIRAHTAVWRKYWQYAGVWPVTSIVIYILRYVFGVVGVVACVWYSERRGWTWSSAALASVTVLAIAVVWIKIEIAIWNRELRERSLTSGTEVWDVTQFPSHRG